jgi:hypothetical protein
MGETMGFDSPAVAYEQLFDEYTSTFQGQRSLFIADDVADVVARVAETINEFDNLRSDAKLALLTAAVVWGVQPALRVGLHPEEVSAIAVQDIRLVSEHATSESLAVVSLPRVISSLDANWAELSLCKKIWGM